MAEWLNRYMDESHGYCQTHEEILVLKPKSPSLLTIKSMGDGAENHLADLSQPLDV